MVRYRSDGLVTAIKQEFLKMSFKTMFRIAQQATVVHMWYSRRRLQRTNEQCL